MLWIIQENIGSEDKYNSFLSNLEKFDQKVELVKVVPFVGDIIPDVEKTDSKVICFGSYSMRKLAIKKNWFPGVYDIEHFSYQDLVKVLGDSVLNHDSQFDTFGNLKPKFDKFFLRPIHDGKEFSGTIISLEDFLEWKKKIVNLEAQDNGAIITSETPVMCSSLKKIQAEYRFFVVGGKAITGSRYKLGSRVVYSNADEMLSLAQTFVHKLKNYLSHPYVLDLAFIDNDYKVVELNTLNCAGFYACDMQKLVNALIEYESN